MYYRSIITLSATGRNLISIMLLLENSRTSVSSVRNVGTELAYVSHNAPGQGV